jgi:hypothetical protein
LDSIHIFQKKGNKKVKKNSISVIFFLQGFFPRFSISEVKMGRKTGEDGDSPFILHEMDDERDLKYECQ